MSRLRLRIRSRQRQVRHVFIPTLTTEILKLSVHRQDMDNPGANPANPEVQKNYTCATQRHLCKRMQLVHVVVTRISDGAKVPQWRGTKARDPSVPRDFVSWSAMSVRIGGTGAMIGTAVVNSASQRAANAKNLIP